MESALVESLSKNEEGRCAVNAIDQVLRALGRIEGELIEIRKVSERVNRLEVTLSWLKGAWAAMAGAGAYLYRCVIEK